jgi:enoyl-CoA hydratase
MTDEDQILYEVADKVAVITLNRPHRANAQTMELLDDLNAAFERAAADEDVRVIVLRGNGKHFSSGHDLSGGGGSRPAKMTLQDVYALEARKYLGYSLSWRNIPKPTIASVQGKAIAGALLLVWPMDLIIAAENAEFSDPVVFMGIGGVEYHGHTWELGPRKAKEILFTGRSVSAREAEQIGMVNKVVPLESLQDETLALAHQIAQNDPFALRQAKRAVNQTLDVQGFYAAIQSVFDIHQTGHGHALSATGYPVLLRKDGMKEKLKEQGGTAPAGGTA